MVQMAQTDDFIQHGLAVARNALTNIAGQANLHLKPEMLTKSARSRCMGRFRALLTVIRRLILLMALEVELPPLRQRMKQEASAPNGAEDVTAGFGPQTAPLRLAPVRVPIAGEAFLQAGRVMMPGPVSAAPVIARWAALYRLLEHPGRAAKRLARTLERWRAAKEPPPHIQPSGAMYRFGAELGLVASLLPQRLAAALSDWPPDMPPRPAGERVRLSGLTLL